MAVVTDSTAATTKLYAGASGNTVVYGNPVTVAGFTFTGGAAATTYRVFDNATTNSGTVLFAATLAIGVTKSYVLPTPLSALAGVTINASATGAAGAVMAF